MATQSSVRYINLRRVLDILFRRGACSRADISRQLEMSRSATSAITADLLEAGLVIETDRQHRDKLQRMGRPSIDVAINPKGGFFVGAEIGVDRLSVVIANLLAQPVSKHSIAFDTASVPAEYTVEVLANLISDITDSYAPNMLLHGICVSLPALLRTDGSVINGLLLNWREVPLLSLLQQNLGKDIPLAIENDANAFAFAETYLRPDNRDENHAFFLLEAGVGGGIVIGGELFRGSQGLAGELGQTVSGGVGFDPSGAPRPGHVESYVGGNALLSHWRQLGSLEQNNLPAFLEALADGNEVARAAACDWGTQLAIGMVQVTAVINPDSIILGGSISAVFNHVADLVEKNIRSELLDGYPLPRIRVSENHDNGPAVGAARLMHQRLFRIESDILPAPCQLRRPS